ncbi:MAG TPA: MFS transporter, partial [Thermoplasmata archaeon]|nr:MFS transporter [Thermoplasmata archaeon]
NPMVDFARLKERNIVLANVAGITAASAMFVFFVSSQTILQVPTYASGLGQTTFYAGLASLPCCLTMLVLAPIMGRAVGTRGPRPVMIVGGGLVLLGGVLFALFNRTVLEATLDAIPILIGVIAAFIAMTNIVVLSSRRQEAGIQTGMNQTFRNIGSAIGPVLASSIISSFTQSVVVAEVPNPANPSVLVPIYRSFPSLEAYQIAFLAVAVLGALTILMALGLRNYRYLPDGTRVEGPVAAPPAGLRPAPSAGEASAAPAGGH